jgi:hypothetical protein
MLLEDPDAEIRATADETLNRIPEEALEGFLARPDVPLGIREFFADRGIFPDEMPDITAMFGAEEPLLDNGEQVDFGDEDEDRESATQKLAKMGFSARLKAAVKGSREMRAMLIRRSEQDDFGGGVEQPQADRTRNRELRQDGEPVGGSAAHHRHQPRLDENYNVVLGLTKNPKTPLALSLNFLQRLTSRDLAQVSVDRNVSEPLRIAARKKVAANRAGSGKSE